MPVTLKPLHFDLKALAIGLGFTEEETMRFYRNGKNAAGLMEAKICKAEGLRPHDRDNADNDGARPHGKIETRCLTQYGLKLPPSKNLGGGRDFSRPDFEAKLGRVIGFYIVDISKFPIVNYLYVSSALVKQWDAQGRLGVRAQVCYNTFWKLFE